MSDDLETQVWPPDEHPPEDQSVFSQITGVGDSDWKSMILLPLLAIFTALLAAGFILLLTDPELWEIWRTEGAWAWIVASAELLIDVYWTLFLGAVGSVRAISETLLSATPLITTGLAVALAFRAGLFNIGAEGQFLIGGTAAVIVGFSWGFLPYPIHALAAIAAGILGGAFWAGIAGFLKARTGAHEVITTIMLNFIAAFFVLWMLSTEFMQVEGRDDPISKSVLESAQLPRLLTFIDPNLRVNLGFILSLLAALFCWWLLFRSTLGYEFRAVGYNPDASKYAGMKVGWLTVLVMAMAGGFAGLAGAEVTLGVLHRASPGFAAGLGFTGIVVALLGRSHPGGVVLAALLIGGLEAGGRQVQFEQQISVELVQIIQAFVLLFIAAPALIRGMYRLKERGGEEESIQLTSGWGA